MDIIISRTVPAAAMLFDIVNMKDDFAASGPRPGSAGRNARKKQEKAGK